MSHPRTHKLAHDFTGLGIEKRKTIKDQKSMDPPEFSYGYANTDLIEPVPNYRRAPCEIINFDITGDAAAKNNCWIILGRDRVHLPTSGYGGMGHTQSAAIYICAGMNSAEPHEETPPAVADRDIKDGFPKDMEYLGEPLACERSFAHDASFIYLSQKCNIDGYLGLGGSYESSALNPTHWKMANRKKADISAMLKMTKFNTLQSFTPRSGAAIKADAVRVVARQSIRLQIFPERGAMGGEPEASGGISLVGAGDATKTQPLVLGYKLVGSYEHLAEALFTLSDSLKNFIAKQTAFNQLVTNHVHVGANGQPTSDAIVAQRAQMAKHAADTLTISYTNLKGFVAKTGTWLSNYTKPGDNFILSSYNFCD